MQHSLGLIAIVVRDYDEAIAFYTGVLGFELIEDSSYRSRTSVGWWWRRKARAKRRFCWRAPSATSSRRGSAIKPADASSCSSIPTISGATIGRSASRGVEFVREPKDERYGTVAVFRDLYGNLWDLLEPRT